MPIVSGYNVGGPRAAAGNQARRATPATGFRLPDAATNAPAAGGATEVSLSGMLALQEGAPGAVRDREARRRGQDLLAALAGLQRDLLGGDPAPGLQRLAALAADVPTADDARLAGIVEAIAVRAAVELARHAKT